MKSADDAGRSAVEFAADQSRCGRQFVSNGFQAGLQRVAVRIAAATIVAQRLSSRRCRCRNRQAFAPRTTECVSDEDGDRELGALLQFAMKLASGTVGIDGQKQGVAAAIDVGDVHAAVGADESVAASP